MKKTVLIIIVLSCFVIKLRAQHSLFDSIWNTKEIKSRIDSGIEMNRKGDAILVVINSKGEMIKDYSIKVSLKQHDFLFGANAFFVNGFSDKAKNLKWEKMYDSLFNYTTVPFYWKDYEPTPGTYRFDKGVDNRFRRPPVDDVLEFCKRNNLKPKGHTFFWDYLRWNIPDWLPKDNNNEQYKYIFRYIDTIINRYDNEIDVWDVVNEVTANYEYYNGWLPFDHIYKIIKYVQTKIDTTDQFIVNETLVWDKFRYEYSPFYLLVQNLLLRDAKIDAIGFQCHFFDNALFNKLQQGLYMQPQYIYDVLDAYTHLGLPIHITEITIPTPQEEGGLMMQAKITENLYKIWFSHPSVEAITWWNIADGTAVMGEDHHLSGLLDKELNPKPSFDVLNKLINEEWRTNISKQHVNGNFDFKGFFGLYNIEIYADGKKINQTVHLKKGEKNKFVIEIK